MPTCTVKAAVAVPDVAPVPVMTYVCDQDCDGVPDRTPVDVLNVIPGGGAADRE